MIRQQAARITGVLNSPANKRYKVIKISGPALHAGPLIYFALLEQPVWIDVRGETRHLWQGTKRRQVDRNKKRGLRSVPEPPFFIIARFVLFFGEGPVKQGQDGGPALVGQKTCARAGKAGMGNNGQR